MILYNVNKIYFKFPLIQITRVLDLKKKISEPFLNCLEYLLWLNFIHELNSILVFVYLI